MNKQTMIAEGLRDYEDMTQCLEFRAAIFARKNANNWNWQTAASEQFRLSMNLLVNNQQDEIKTTIMLACKEQAKQRRMKRHAETIGLVYWPALYCHDVDPAAFVAAEQVLIPRFNTWSKDCHGGWDSYNYHGVSPWFVKTAWFNAGCKDTPKFRKQIMARDHAKKGETLEKFQWYLDGKKWMEANMIYMNLSRKAIITLGRLSPVSRWAALSDLEECDSCAPRRIRDLNWQRVKEVSEMKLWKKCQQPELPNRLRWNISGKDVPAALQTAWLSRPRPSWVKGAAGQIGPFDLAPKIVESLMDLPEEEFAPLVMLHKFWGKELPRALTELYPEMSTHDAGQDLVRLSIEESHSEFLLEWRKLAWKTRGASLQYCSQYTEIRVHMGVPQTLNELKLAAALCQYRNVTEKTRPVAEICAKYNLGEPEFNTYCRLFGSPQADHSTIPGTRITGTEIGLEGDWLLERLATDDLIGPFLGLATNCCQHLHSAGADCARKIWTDERSAAWVVRYNGGIVAQSYVWRDQSSLVIDSIEALGGAYVEGIAKLYQKAVNQIIGQFGIEDVLLACTSYGITKQVRKIMVPNAEKFQHTLNCPSQYSDARKVVKIR
jgi:hypothetical protein